MTVLTQAELDALKSDLAFLDDTGRLMPAHQALFIKAARAFLDLMTEGEGDDVR